MGFKERILEESFKPVMKGIAAGSIVGGIPFMYGMHKLADQVRKDNYKKANVDYNQQQEYITKGLVPENPIQEVPMGQEGDVETLVNLAKNALTDQ